MNQLLHSALRMAAVSFITFISFSTNAQSNYALNLDGSNDHVTTSAYVVPTSGNFTVELWVYANNYTGYQEFVSQGAAGSAFYIGTTNGTGVIRCGDNWAATGVTLPLNQWVHVALVKSGGSATLYLDGVQKANIGSGYSISGAGTNFQMGTQYGGLGEYFNGKMDELRVWNVARTHGEIKANMFNKTLSNNASGMVGYYRFNEGINTTAANSCTNTAGIDGTLVNGTAWTDSPIKFGNNALSFDGTNDYVVSTATFNLNMNNSSYSVEAWINSGDPLANTTTERIIMQWGNTWQAGGYQLVCTDSYIKFNFNGSSTNLCIYNVSWQDGNWHHVAGVFDIATHMLYLYYDGVQRAAVSTGSNAPGALNHSLYIGGSPSVANSFATVKIDEVRVWNTARTQAELQAYMNTEINHPFNNGGGVPRLYYTFNQGIATGTNTGLVTISEQYLQAHGNGTLVNFALTGASNYVTQNSSLFILPIQWHGFTAQKQNDGVMLEWSTDQEQNTRDFIIQHSIEGSKWNSIATVTAAGRSNSVRNYNYSHINPSSGTNYYRIQQNDQDGKYSYSEIRAVRMNERARSFEVISNPVINKTMQLQINSTTDQTIQLFEIDGKLIWTKKFCPGVHAVGLGSMKSGVYILKGERYTQKLVVD